MILRIAELIVFLACSGCVTIISAAVSASRPLSTNQPLDSPDTIKNSSVCWTDDVAYNDQDVVPGVSPCEQCICNPPTVLCSMVKCEVKSGCKIIQQPNQCCPDYKCDTNTPSNRLKLPTTNSITLGTSKHGSKPWLFTTDSARTLEPDGELTTSAREEDLKYISTETTSKSEKNFTTVMQPFKNSDSVKATTMSSISGDNNNHSSKPFPTTAIPAKNLTSGFPGGDQNASDPHSTTVSYFIDDDIITDEASDAVPEASATSESTITTTAQPNATQSSISQQSTTSSKVADVVQSSKSQTTLQSIPKLVTSDKNSETSTSFDEHHLKSESTTIAIQPTLPPKESNSSEHQGISDAVTEAVTKTSISFTNTSNETVSKNNSSTGFHFITQTPVSTILVNESNIGKSVSNTSERNRAASYSVIGFGFLPFDQPNKTDPSTTQLPALTAKPAVISSESNITAGEPFFRADSPASISSKNLTSVESVTSTEGRTKGTWLQATLHSTSSSSVPNEINTTMGEGASKSTVTPGLWKDYQTQELDVKVDNATTLAEQQSSSFITTSSPSKATTMSEDGESTDTYLNITSNPSTTIRPSPTNNQSTTLHINNASTVEVFGISQQNITHLPQLPASTTTSTYSPSLSTTHPLTTNHISTQTGFNVATLNFTSPSLLSARNTTYTTTTSETTIFDAPAIFNIDNVTSIPFTETSSHFDNSTVFSNDSILPIKSTFSSSNDSLDSNYTEQLYLQKFVVHPVKLINSVNSVFLSAGLGYRESLDNQTTTKTAANTSYSISATPANKTATNSNATLSEDSKGLPSPAYKILLDGLKPVTRPPNSTMAPLSWLKGSLPVTHNFTSQVIASAAKQPQKLPVNVTIEGALKNESRQEPAAEAKRYDPLMPYPEEYPEEYQTIQNGPAIIITRTTYTRIPDVTWTTVTMATLPTYRQVQKAEEGFASTLFDRKFHERSYTRKQQAIDDDRNAGETSSQPYFNKDMMAIEKQVDEKKQGVKSVKSAIMGEQKLKAPTSSQMSRSGIAELQLDEKDTKIIQNFMNKNLKL